MIIKNFEPYIGVHCETTATGCLLKQKGIELSEPMLFGLGEGLSYIFWKMKSMGFPFIGGRLKPMLLSKNIARNLNLHLKIEETSSSRKAWENVVKALEEGRVVGLQLDSYHLEYFPEPFHFAGHFVALYGYDNLSAYLVDTSPNGSSVKTSLSSLELARGEKGPMAAKNLMYTLNKTDRDFLLENAIYSAISNNVQEYLNPPIKNIGYKGILKTSVEIKNWFNKSSNIQHEFETTAMLMEKAGTGGALFRNLYRDFLQEAYDLTGMDPLGVAHMKFIEIAENWTHVANLIAQAGSTGKLKYVDQASEILKELSSKEHSAMQTLENITKQ